MTAVPRIALAAGYTVAPLINGGWQLAAGHGAEPRDRQTLFDDLLRLVDAGFTTFDCADIYTGVEALLGELLRRNRRRGGPAIQVHTKVVPDRAALPTLDRRYLERVVERSLRRLGVERLDLVQLHWWDYRVAGWVDAARWLDRLRRAGKIRHLGVTNFDLPRLRAIVDAGVPVLSHQVQYSLLDRRPEHGMADYCRRRGIHLLCYGTLAGGYLSARYRGLPAPPPPADRSQVKYRLILDEAGGWPALERLHRALAEIADRHGVSMAAVALRAVLERPAVAAAIVGTRSAAHLASRHQALALRLDDRDRRALDAALAAASGPAGDVYALERLAGSRHAAIMRTDLNRLA